jgi:hypothetical protein
MSGSKLSVQSPVAREQRIARGLAFGMLLVPVGATMWLGFYQLVRAFVGG